MDDVAAPPAAPALRRTLHLLRTVPRDRTTVSALLDAVRGLPWVLRERRVLPPHAEARFAALEAGAAQLHRPPLRQLSRVEPGGLAGQVVALGQR